MRMKTGGAQPGWRTHPSLAREDVLFSFPFNWSLFFSLKRGCRRRILDCGNNFQMIPTSGRLECLWLSIWINCREQKQGTKLCFLPRFDWKNHTERERERKTIPLTPSSFFFFLTHKTSLHHSFFILFIFFFLDCYLNLTTTLSSSYSSTSIIAHIIDYMYVYMFVCLFRNPCTFPTLQCSLWKN